MFVGFPSQKNNDDEYHDTVWADKDVKDQVIELAKREYGNDATNQEDFTPLAIQDEDVPF